MGIQELALWQPYKYLHWGYWQQGVISACQQHKKGGLGALLLLFSPVRQRVQHYSVISSQHIQTQIDRLIVRFQETPTQANREIGTVSSS